MTTTALTGPASRVTTVACAAVLGISLVYDVMLIAIARSGALGRPRGWHRSAEGAPAWPAM